MSRSSVVVVVYAVTPSSYTIKAPRQPYIPNIEHQGKQGDQVPPSQTFLWLDGRVEVRMPYALAMAILYNKLLVLFKNWLD